MKKNYLIIFITLSIISGCEKIHDENNEKTEWQDVSVNTNALFNKIEMVNNDIGFVAGRLNSTKPQNIYLTEYIDSNENCVNLDQSTPMFSWVLKDIVSTDSCLYRTTNGGLDWKPVKLPFSTYLDMSFINELIGFILTDEGVYKTIDGCKSWNKILSNKVYYSENVSTRAFDHIKFISEDEGFIYTNYFKHGICLFVSISGDGKVKNIINSSVSTPAETYFSSVDELIFPETKQETGILVSNGQILLSSDRGRSWKIKNREKRLDDLECLNNSTWIGTNQGSISRTDDGGNTWHGISSTALNIDILKSINNDLLIASDISDLYISGDDGLTFRKMTKPYGEIHDICVTSDNVAIAVGSNGKILRFKY